MSKAKVIELTGDISSWNISRSYAKYLADNAGQGELIVDVCSLGGDVNEALGIKKLFADRGDVTIRYFGFNASAATIIGHGAAKTQIYEDAMYLIHKPLLWVDEWGRMNEDDIQAAIDNLQAQKKDAEAVTLMIVNDYVKNRGMELKTVMDLMKQERWLTAQEAVDLGLVDELIPATTGKKTTVSNSMVAMMKANGFPELPSNSSDDEKEETLITKIVNRITNTQKPPKTEMRKDLTFVNQVLAVDGVNENNGSITLTVDQVLALNNKLKADGESITALTTARDTAQNSLTTLNTAIDAIDATVAAATTPETKVAAINAKLANRPAAAAAVPAGGDKQDSVVDSVEWEEINNLPHNKEADKLIC